MDGGNLCRCARVRGLCAGLRHQWDPPGCVDPDQRLISGAHMVSNICRSHRGRTTSDLRVSPMSASSSAWSTLLLSQHHQRTSMMVHMTQHLSAAMIRPPDYVELN